jgi:hypothetical protein
MCNDRAQKVSFVDALLTGHIVNRQSKRSCLELTPLCHSHRNARGVSELTADIPKPTLMTPAGHYSCGVLEESGINVAMALRD